MKGAVTAPFPADVTALADRATVENFMAEYYAHLDDGDADLSKYFASDAVLDVNGLIAKGADEINALYVRARGGEGAKPKRDPKAPPPGGELTLLTNLKVEVKGNTAVAEMYWTSMAANLVIAAPHIPEYGRDHTELAKVQGHWLIKRRVITSYGGMPEGELEAYKKSRVAH